MWEHSAPAATRSHDGMATPKVNMGMHFSTMAVVSKKPGFIPNITLHPRHPKGCRALTGLIRSNGNVDSPFLLPCRGLTLRLLLWCFGCLRRILDRARGLLLGVVTTRTLREYYATIDEAVASGVRPRAFLRQDTERGPQVCQQHSKNAPGPVSELALRGLELPAQWHTMGTQWPAALYLQTTSRGTRWSVAWIVAKTDLGSLPLC